MADDSWEGGTFDPRSIRHFSILPDEDRDEAHCVRHDREMREIEQPVIHRDGGLYSTTSGFSIYTCERCVKELDSMASEEGAGVAAYRKALKEAFDLWDKGDSPGEWFKYMGEGSIEKRDDGDFIAFG